MKLEVSILCALLAGTVSSQYSEYFLLDANGNLHKVNPNPYTVIDLHLEPYFNAETDIIFRLYTRKNPKVGQILKPNGTFSVLSSNFNPQRQTRILVHGWFQDGDAEMLRVIRDSYLLVGDFNVINVDWGEGAITINYRTARYRVNSVGLVTSQMIDTLVKATGISLDSINIIGHSLGAHIAGVAGRRRKGLVNSVIGLDPAGPWFSADSNDLLDENAARYVEAIFTSKALGYYEPLGTANFYPNGASGQPGCPWCFPWLCAHSRAWMYFAESLTSRVGFRATRCESYDHLISGQCGLNSPGVVTMGGEPSNHGKGVKGVYLISTNSEPPYAMQSNTANSLQLDVSSRDRDQHKEQTSKHAYTTPSRFKTPLYFE